ncbi:MAG: glutamine synthetase [Candidatus Hydrogenedentes bacterium]|nr:glutamine synthetase [Candidatus Hydrogenedentota bacterium]
MSSHKAMTASQVRSLIESEEIVYIKIGVFDVDGILRGKYMHRDKFLSAMDEGFGFCDVVLGWDSNDQLYDSSTYTGWHTAYPDAPVRVLPETCRRIPFEENTVLLLGEFEGEAEKICPRGVLRRVLERAESMGFSVLSSFEFEFFLFEETPHSVREKGYRDLKPITPGFFGYSVLRNSVHAEYYHELLDTCEAMGFPLEGLHTETGPGVLEAALQHTEGLESADRAALFKTFTKVLAQRRGWMATFMAKWSQDWPGQSGHIHVSLKDKNGGTPFYDADKPDSISDTMRWFIGGQQALMPELLSMVACTVNSYSRLIPGFWAPTHANWGVDNRTCALRAISGSAAAQRVEYRIAAADINPYISLAAALGSGLWGIGNEIEPTDPVKGNAYAKKFPKALDLPKTLFDAAQKLRKSKAAKELFGDAFVEHYAQSREWEEREFRKSITHWELERYFEII